MQLLTGRGWYWPVAGLILAGELVLNFGIVTRLKYTEIDWTAYMEEVAGVVEKGDYDYTHLAGGTGPLVYPAGFVYLYTALYYITDKGTNVRLAQWIFVGLYMSLMALICILYRRANIPQYVLVFAALSYRIHSIFVLRLFNDCWAMFFLYLALALFVTDQWTIGCYWFSVAVSIKMNVMLFAPPLFLLLLKRFGFWATIPRLAVCAVVQVVPAIPFLLANPGGYLQRSFDLGRQFFYRWTVNWRFLPEDIFLSKNLSIGLLVAHVSLLLLFAFYRWAQSEGGLMNSIGRGGRLRADHILTLMFTGNLIGIAFARSLHYQFYVWYFHSLPFLFHQTQMAPVLGLLGQLAVEVAFNVYPSTGASSAALHCAHAALLVGLWMAPVPPPRDAPRRGDDGEAKEAVTAPRGVTSGATAAATTNNAKRRPGAKK